MSWLVKFFYSYRDYFGFIFWAMFISLFYYFLVATFFEMNMDLVKKTLRDRHGLIGAFFALLNTILYVAIIYFFAQVYVARGASSIGTLFLLIAWSFSVIKINQRFNTQPWFSFLLFSATWLSILFLWL